MSGWDVLILLMVAAIVGAIAQMIAGFSRGGFLVAIVVGFFGALLGMWMWRLTGAPELLVLQVGNYRFPIIWSVIGGVVFVVIISLISPRRTYLRPTV